VHALHGVAAALGQARGVSRDAVGDPVGEAVDQRGVGIVDHHGERLRAVGDPGPGQFGSDVLAVPGMALRDGGVMVKGGALKLAIGDVEFLWHDGTPTPRDRSETASAARAGAWRGRARWAAWVSGAHAAAGSPAP